MGCLTVNKMSKLLTEFINKATYLKSSLGGFGITNMREVGSVVSVDVEDLTSHKSFILKWETNPKLEVNLLTISEFTLKSKMLSRFKQAIFLRWGKWLF